VAEATSYKDFGWRALVTAADARGRGGSTGKIACATKAPAKRMNRTVALTLRTGAAGSQDESHCGAIHKVERKSTGKIACATKAPAKRMNRAVGPTLRTGAAGSQDESRCGAIHKVERKSTGRIAYATKAKAGRPALRKAP
jgi:hypothetical protein